MLPVAVNGVGNLRGIVNTLFFFNPHIPSIANFCKFPPQISLKHVQFFPPVPLPTYSKLSSSLTAASIPSGPLLIHSTAKLISKSNWSYFLLPLPPTSFKSPSAASQRWLQKDELKTAPGPCAVPRTHFIAHPPSRISCSLQWLPSFQPAMTPSLQACAPLCRLENRLSSPLDRINSQASFRCQLRSHFPRKSYLITQRIRSNLPILSAKNTSFLSNFPPLLLFTFCGCHLLHQTACFPRAGTVSILVYHFISST